jgi:hypothetical protein
MVTRVYAAGVKATAIANIKADIAGYISTNANGEQVLDTDGLRTYLEAQFQAISTTPEYVAPADASSSMTAALSAPVTSLVSNLNAQINVARWSTRSDWPIDIKYLTGGELVSAIRAGVEELKSLSLAVTSHYEQFAWRLLELVDVYFTAAGLDAGAPEGVVRLMDTRYYIHTFVTDKGEESGPSAVSEVVRPDQNDTVTVGRAVVPSGRNITYWQVYRSASGNEGDGFQLIPNPSNILGWPVATTAITDDLDPTELQGTCRTLTWSEPPAALKGIISGENGGGAGFAGNDWCPWVNFYPYAYRVQDRKSTEHPIVAQGIINSTYVVLTRGHPYFITGTDSTAMSADPKREGQACLAARGVVSMLGGVVYPGPDGLIFATLHGFKTITGPVEQGGYDLYTKEEWEALNPSTIFAAELEGCYVYSFGTGGAVYSLNIATGKLTKLDVTASAFYRDPLTDRLYAATGTTITALLASATRRTAVWESKDVMMADHPSLSWLRVRSDFTANGQAATVTVKYYGNDVLIHTKALSDRKPVRLPAGKFDRIKIRIESTARVTDLTACSTTRELQGS